MAGRKKKMDFASLVYAIRKVDEQCSAQAGRAVNVSLTLRNWAIGCYIREYEQHGADRAEYGEGLLDRLADRLRQEGMIRMDSRELRRYRQFYLVYSRIWRSLTPELQNLLPASRLPIQEIRESVTPEFAVNGNTLINHLSFTHLNELSAIEDPLKRTFYEIECIRGRKTMFLLSTPLQGWTINFSFPSTSSNSRKKKRSSVFSKKRSKKSEIGDHSRTDEMKNSIKTEPKELGYGG